MRKIISVILIMSLLLSMVACGEISEVETTIEPTTQPIVDIDPFAVADNIIDSTNEIPIDYYEYVAMVCGEREEWVNSAHDYTEFIDKLSMHASDPDLLTEAEFDMLTTANTPLTKIAVTSAINDTVWLFKILKSCYGCYTYFGEENFSKAEEDILDILNNYSSASIDVEDFYDMILAHLDFIVDSHMHFYYKYSDNSPVTMTELNNAYCYSYFGTDYVFRQDDCGYYTTIYDKKWYIDNVDGNDPSEYLKVSIDTSGELVYRVISVHNPCYTADTASLTLTRDDSSVDVDFVWEMMTALYDNVYNEFRYSTTDEPMSGLKIENDVPILSIRYFKEYMPGDDKLLASYVASGKELSNQSTFIVDARSNGGDSNSYAMNWSKNYSGSVHYYPTFDGNRKTYVNPSDTTKTGDSTYSIYGSKFYTGNTNNIIFLTDKSSGSSGECIVEEFMMYNNVLIVGTNTNGCTIGGNGTVFYLPTSGIYFNVGRNYCIRSDSDNILIEGLGHMPDVFVQSLEAETLSLAMIEYYELEKSQNLDELTLFGWE